MATLQNIRNKGKLLAVVIGLALASFVLGDMLSSGKALFGGNENDVVSVNKNHVNIQDFEQLVLETEQYIKISQGKTTLDAQTSQQIRSTVWDMTIRKGLLEDTYKELGLGVSTEELSDMVLGNHVHPIVSQTFMNQQTGEFDKQQVINLIKGIEEAPQNPEHAEQIQKVKMIWLYIEDYIKTDRKFTKYQALVSKGLYVTNLEVEEDNFERTYTVDIDLVGKTINDIQDTTMTATEQEIEEYYEKHKNLFKNNESSRDISYITFKTLPSALDSLDAQDKIGLVKTELELSPDEFIPSRQAVLIKYFSPEDLDIAIADSVVFAAEKGKVIGAYLDFGVYNLLKVLDIDTRPDTVSARHILISPQNPKIGSMLRAQEVADSILNVLNAGGDFATLVTNYSDDPGSIDNGGLYEDIKEGDMVTEFNDYCFETKIGVIGTVETQFGIHIIEVTEQKNLVEKRKLAIYQEPIEASPDTYNDVYSQAKEITGLATNQEEFDKVVAENGYFVTDANVLQGAYTVSGLEDAKKIVSWCFKTNEGTVSNVFEYSDKCVIVLLRNKNEVGFLTLDNELVKKQVEASVIQRKQVDKIYADNFENQTVTDLDAFATKLGVQKLSIPQVSFSAFQLMTIGYEPAIIGAIKMFKKNEIYGPIKGLNGVYYVKATAITDVIALTAEETLIQKNKMKVAMQQRASYQSYTALKNAAKIVDRRSNF